MQTNPSTPGRLTSRALLIATIAVALLTAGLLALGNNDHSAHAGGLAEVGILPDPGVSPVNPQEVQGTPGTARARLLPFRSSGISGTLNFEQDAIQLRVTGSATGFTPFRQYVSLVYGNKTVATGPKACGRDDTLNFEQMVLAEWLPVDATTRTLQPVSKVTVTLDQIKTASIRMVDAPLLPNPFQDLPPQAFVLRACGLIQR